MGKENGRAYKRPTEKMAASSIFRRSVNCSFVRMMKGRPKSAKSAMVLSALRESEEPRMFEPQCPG